MEKNQVVIILVCSLCLGLILSLLINMKITNINNRERWEITQQEQIAETYKLAKQVYDREPTEKTVYTTITQEVNIQDVQDAVNKRLDLYPVAECTKIYNFDESKMWLECTQ